MVDNEFQARSKEEGAQAQKMARQVLQGAGFHVTGANVKLPDCGITMNLVATDKQSGEWLFDVSGAFTSTRDGLIRTDTMWKTLGRANVLHQIGKSRRLVFLTTNLPPRDSVGDKSLHLASATFFDAIEMLTKEGKERLRRYGAGGDQLPVPGFRSAQSVYADIALPRKFGAMFVIPVAKIGPIPGLNLRIQQRPFHLKIILPSVDQDDQPIPVEKRSVAAAKIKSELSGFAGGCTAQQGQGSWLHPVTGVMDEDVSMIESYSDVAFDLSVVGRMIETILTGMNQHTAAVVMDDVMYLFSTDV